MHRGLLLFILFFCFFVNSSRAADPAPTSFADLIPKTAPAGEDRYSLEVQTGYATPGISGNVKLRGLGGLGVAVSYRALSWLSAGIGYDFSAFPANDRVGLSYLLIHNDILAEGLVRWERIGVYAGLRAGVGLANFSISGSFSGQAFMPVVGPRIGYRYEFTDLGFSLGPDFSWLFYPSAVMADNFMSYPLAAHDTKRLFITASFKL